MQNEFSSLLPKYLKTLADVCPFPLYLVGGSVRDYIAGFPQTKEADYDIAAPTSPERLWESAETLGFKKKGIYPATGTLKIESPDGTQYEFTSFRSDRYTRGHTPSEVYFTEDISLDARRRDFTCNAVYYDIREEKFVDPLGGISDIERKKLKTVSDADKVFSEDGLRLMRLSRQAAQLGFTPDYDCLEGAKKNSGKILEIHTERIYSELKALLLSDLKHRIKYAHYNGLKLLFETGVGDFILPELKEGDKLPQRKDFHDHDVLEHNLRCAMYSEPDETLRFAALLHDVGKSECIKTNGNCHDHEEVSAELAEKILKRLMAPKKVTARATLLIREHMRDFNCSMRETRLRRYIVANAEIIPDLLKLKQADYSACKDSLSAAPTVARWENLIEKMHSEKVPFSLRELAVSGATLIEEGIPKEHTSEVLKGLLLECAVNPDFNKKEKLISLSRGVLKQLQARKKINEPLKT